MKIKKFEMIFLIYVTKNILFDHPCGGGQLFKLKCSFSWKELYHLPPKPFARGFVGIKYFFYSGLKFINQEGQLTPCTV